MGCRFGSIVYAIAQFIAFLLILVGTPIDMFRSKGTDTLGNTNCFTMWGLKSKCYSTKYDTRPSDVFSYCNSRVNMFRAAEAFAILNILIYLVACILGFIQLCCCHCFRWVCLVLNIFGITSVVSWAIMASSYGNASSMTGLNPYCYALKKVNYKYGAGFALLVTAWCLNLVNIVFLLLPC